MLEIWGKSLITAGGLLLILAVVYFCWLRGKIYQLKVIEKLKNGAVRKYVHLH